MQTRFLGALLLCICFGFPAAAHSPPHNPSPHSAVHKAPSKAKASPPVAVKKQKGKASYYARSFSGKKMADGTRFNPASNAAASKTLPLGTKARVKNLETGKSAVVEIRDRGPYVKGRIVDVTPGTAAKLGMKEDGVAQVEVTPISVPRAE